MTPPFEQSAYLFNQTYDTTYTGDGSWGQYRAWLNLPQLGVETDGGGSVDDWWGSCEEAGWNFAWGTQQADPKYAGVMPDILLGDYQMPFLSSGQYDQTWQLEAAPNGGDPATMQHFVQFAANVLCTPGTTNNHYSGYVPSVAAKSVIVRLGYEFDGGWNPYGNLNVMSNMPNNYIQSWRNIVTTVRAHDLSHVIKFCWNPTDSNVQINTDSYYPGDAWVDYIALDTYDKEYSGVYHQGTQPSAAAQASVWQNTLLPRLNHFRDLAVAHNKPLIVGEWGTWDLNSAPGGGDDPGYVQNMFNWMSDPNNHVYMEDYYDIPASDGDHQLWPGLNGRTTEFPQAALKYRDAFGVSYSYGSTAAPIPGTVQAANYDTGGQGIAYNETANGGQTGYRSDNSSADFGPGLGWTIGGQWYKYTVNVASAGTYAVTFSVEAPSSGGTFHLENKSGTNLTGPVTCPATGGWSTPGTVTASVPLPAGPQVLKWVQDSGGYNLLSMTFTASGGAVPIGRRIGIKSSQTGYFTSSDQGDSTYLKALWSTSPGAWEVFDVVDAGGGGVAFLCEQTGKYVTADANQASRVLRADSASTIGPWETFQWANQGGGVFGLKANADGLYVSCNLNDGDRLEAQWAQSVGSWEQFTWSDQGAVTGGALITGTEFDDGAGPWGGNQANVASSAFDGDPNTFYDCANATGFVGIDAGLATSVSKIVFAPRAGFESRMVGGVFEGSNTSATAGYTTLGTVTATPTDGLTNTLTVTNATPYRWLRYRDSQNGSCDVSEIQFVDPPVGVPAVPAGLKATAGATGD